MNDYYSLEHESLLIEHEQSAISAGRIARRGSNAALLPWTGLALSGGGIRSATIALGALQVLARRGLLKHFDYISTVSGGGYIGSSIQWWLSKTRFDREPAGGTGPRPTFGLDQKTFPYGSSNPKDPTPADEPEQTNVLKYLRSHGYYLTPGGGLSIWSMIAVVVRTVLLSLAVWLPLLMLFFFLLLAFDSWLVDEQHLPAWFKALGLDFAKSPSPLGSIIPTAWGEVKAASPSLTSSFKLRATYALLIWLFVLSAVVFLVLTFVFAFLSRSPGEKKSRCRRLIYLFFVFIGSVALGWLATNWTRGKSTLQPELIAALILAALFGLTFTVRWSAELFRGTPISWSYRLRRLLERGLGTMFSISLAVLVFGLVPVLPWYAVNDFTKSSIALGALSGFAGVISALYGYYSIFQKIEPGLGARIFAPIGAACYLYGTMVLAYMLAVFAFSALDQNSSLLLWVAKHFAWSSASLTNVIRITAAVAITLSFLVGGFSNVNFVGLHRFYRDRLMEAFMPFYATTVEEDKGRASPAADTFLLSDIAKPDLSGPFPILNSIAIIRKGSTPTVTVRGGDNFAMTPLFVGSAVTGWESVASHNTSHAPLTLASAMAASGAAVNPNSGYIGTGLTRNPLVSAAMTILNMRLGMWVANPNRRFRKWKRVPNFFRPILTSGLFSGAVRPRSPFIELSDGGNFENLGIYELVRRNLNIILVIDGESDSAIALPALVSAIRRVKEDFNTTIIFDQQPGPNDLVPSGPVVGYPPGTQFAKSPFALATIKYDPKRLKPGQSDQGLLVYVKSVMIQDVDFTTAGYRAQYATFPHQSTVDQFFDPSQFEAYRDLGYQSTKQAIDGAQLTTKMTTPL